MAFKFFTAKRFGIKTPMCSRVSPRRRAPSYRIQVRYTVHTPSNMITDYTGLQD